MKSSPLTVSASLSVGGKRGALGSQRWMELLASIRHTRSIAKSAKLAGLTYKAAWDAVSAMNNFQHSGIRSLEFT